MKKHCTTVNADLAEFIGEVLEKLERIRQTKKSIAPRCRGEYLVR